MSDYSTQSAPGYPPPPPGMGYMPPSDPYALRVGFGKRLGAYLIDFVILFVLGLVLPPLFGIDPDALAANMGDPETADIMGMFSEMLRMNLPIYAVQLLYTLTELFTGGLPGKHILGIVVAHEDRRQGTIALFSLRWAVKFSPFILMVLASLFGSVWLFMLSMLFLLVFLIGCFMALGEKKQALHDVIAKTAIYHKVDVVPADAPATQPA